MSKNCCGCITLKEGVIVIAILSIINNGYHIFSGDPFMEDFVINLFINYVSLFFNFLAIIGAAYNSVGCITTFLVYTILLLLVSVVEGLIILIIISFNTTIVVIFGIAFFVELYFIYVIAAFLSQLKKDLNEVADNKNAPITTINKDSSAVINDVANIV